MANVELKDCIAKLQASEALSASPRLQSLFAYLADNALDDSAPPLKEYSVGLDVFDRREDFNPQTDSIVRVHAGRLRKAITSYYEDEGRNDAYVISLPRGGYKLEFDRRTVRAGASQSASSGRQTPPIHSPRSENGNSGYFIIALALLVVVVAIVTMVVSPASEETIDRALASDPGVQSPVGAQGAPASGASLQHLSDGLTLAIAPFSTSESPSQDNDRRVAANISELLASAMSHSSVIRVASSRRVGALPETIDVKRLGEALNVRFVVYGRVKGGDNRYRVNVELIDTVTEDVVWTQIYEQSGPDEMAVENKLVQRISGELRPQLFTAAMDVIGDTPPADAQAWHYFMVANWSSGSDVDSLAWEQERIALAKQSLKLDPEFGPSHAVLANKLAFLASVDPPSDTNDTRQLALWHVRQAMLFSSDDSDAMFAVGLAHWHLGRLDEATRMFQRTLSLDPNHVLAGFLSWAAPYSCARAPDDALMRMTDYTDSLSSNDPSRWLPLFFQSQMLFNRGEFDAAVQIEAQVNDIFTNPLSIYRYAAILVELGRVDEARTLLDLEKARWPNQDPDHYAHQAMKRRCGGDNDLSARQPYIDLAAAMAD